MAAARIAPITALAPQFPQPRSTVTPLYPGSCIIPTYFSLLPTLLPCTSLLRHVLSFFFFFSSPSPFFPSYTSCSYDTHASLTFVAFRLRNNDCLLTFTPINRRHLSIVNDRPTAFEIDPVDIVTNSRICRTRYSIAH